MWKLIKGNLRKVDSVARRGGWKGEPFNSMSITGKLSITDPDRRNCQEERIINYRPPTGKDGQCNFYKETIPATQPMRNSSF